MRNTLESTHGISSTVLIDDGPRRWTAGGALGRGVRAPHRGAGGAGGLRRRRNRSEPGRPRPCAAAWHDLRRDEMPPPTRHSTWWCTASRSPPARSNRSVVGTPGLTIGRGAVEMTVYEGLDDPVEIAAQISRSVLPGTQTVGCRRRGPSSWRTRRVSAVSGARHSCAGTAMRRPRSGARRGGTVRSDQADRHDGPAHASTTAPGAALGDRTDVGARRRRSHRGRSPRPNDSSDGSSRVDDADAGGSEVLRQFGRRSKIDGR